MYAPVRAGTRGGQGDFKWSDVKDDKDRENYLGHSILAPKGRWQNNRDITWYNKDAATSEDAKAEQEREMKEEIRRIKEVEEEALGNALGFNPSRGGGGGGGGGSANQIPLAQKKPIMSSAESKELKKLEKLERKNDRAVRRDARAVERSNRPVKSSSEREGRRKEESSGRERERRRDSRSKSPERSSHRDRR